MKFKNIFLGKVDIRNNAVLIDKNTLISIIDITPVNLSELSENSKQQLILEYQYFLRSLIYPIHIILRFVNKDSQKLLYRKRMVTFENEIKKTYKKNTKDIIAECDEFKKWLKYFLDLRVRPKLISYLVIPVITETNLIKNETAYIEAIQLLNQRTNQCISRLSSINLTKKPRNHSKRCEWEEKQLTKIQEKYALLELGMFKKKDNYYFLSNLKLIPNGKRKISDYLKRNSYDAIIEDKSTSLKLSRLDDERIVNLIESYTKDFIVLNKDGFNKYIFVKDLFQMSLKG